MLAVSTESSSAIRSRSSEAIEAASALRASTYNRFRSFASAVAWRAAVRVVCSYSRLAPRRSLGFHSHGLLLLALAAGQLALQVSPQASVLRHFASRHASDPSSHTVTDSYDL